MNKEIKERILVVEDDHINMICALAAFGYDESFEDVIIIPSYDEAVEAIDKFRPTVALLDVNIKGRGTGKDIGGILKEKGIPYVYVTGVSRIGDHSDDRHKETFAIEIQSEDETLGRFEKVEKDQEIWRTAYEKLKELKERR